MDAGAIGVPAESHAVQPIASDGQPSRHPTADGPPTSYQVGNRVRVDIPDGDDPDHRYHGGVGWIEEVLQDDLSQLTGNPRNDYLYGVRFENEEFGRMSFRYHDLERVD